MRYLLKQYVPKGTTLSQLMDRPRYDLERTHGDEKVQQVFYCIYHEAAFIESGGKWLPNYEHVMNVEDVPGIRENMVATEEVIKRFQAIKRIVKRAACGKVEQYKAERPEAIKVQAAVNGYFRCSVNTSLSADGGDIYAELSVASINKLLKMLKTKVGIREDDILVDGGCGYNFMMAHSAQVTGCRVYGIEYVPTKIYLAMKSTLRAIKEGGLSNYKIGYVPWDMYLLEALGPATIAIFNDEAFPLPLVEHICKILLKPSTTLKAAVFFKPSKAPTLRQYIADWGHLELVATLPGLQKYKSLEGNTAYLYKRAKGNKSARHDGQFNVANGLTTAAMMHHYLAPAWSEDPETRHKHYSMALTNAEANLPGRTRNITAMGCGDGVTEEMCERLYEM
jgi:hypothetical protein